MLKNITRIECKVNEKTYQFLCDMDSTLTDCKEALFQFMAYVGKIEENIKNSQKSEEDKLKEMGISIEESPEIIEQLEA